MSVNLGQSNLVWFLDNSELSQLLLDMKVCRCSELISKNRSSNLFLAHFLLQQLPFISTFLIC